MGAYSTGDELLANHFLILDALRGAAAIAFVVNGARYSSAEDGVGLGKADARARGVAGEASV